MKYHGQAILLPYERILLHKYVSFHRGVRVTLLKATFDYDHIRYMYDLL